MLRTLENPRRWAELRLYVEKKAKENWFLRI
jgi:hypothetical protein